MFLLLGDLLDSREALHATRASEHASMPVDDTSKTSRDEVLSNVSHRADDYDGSDIINLFFFPKNDE